MTVFRRPPCPACGSKRCFCLQEARLIMEELSRPGPQVIVIEVTRVPDEWDD